VLGEELGELGIEGDRPRGGWDEDVTRAEL
jgi:hypothetical protein